MSHPQYPYSPVANDESYSLTDFVNDPWWKWFRNWRHLTNRGRVLVHTRYLNHTMTYNAALAATTAAATVTVACSPLDRVFVVLPYFVINSLGSLRYVDLRIAHNVTTAKLDGSHANTSTITRFPARVELSRAFDGVVNPDEVSRGIAGAHVFGPSGPIDLGWPIPVGGAGWTPGQVEGFMGPAHRHVCAALARGGDTANNGALALTYRCSWTNSNATLQLDAQVALRGLTVVAFRLQDL